MESTFPLEIEFAECWAKNSRPEHFQVYIYLLCQMHKTGKVLSADETASRLNVPKNVVEGAFDFWRAVGKLRQTAVGGYEFVTSLPKPEEGDETAKAAKVAEKGVVEARPAYSPGEVDKAMGDNEELAFLMKQAQLLLGKPLRSSDVELLYSFYDWLGLPVSVIVMLLTYLAGKDKKSMRYIEQVAITWADQGINTFEAADKYLKYMEKLDGREGKIRQLLGINDRNPSENEKKFISAWAGDRNLPLELVTEAYSRTAEATGKLSMAYMDKILRTWKEKGIKTLEKLKQSDEEYKSNRRSPFVKPQPKPAGTRFNNFTNRDAVDYDEAAKRKAENMRKEG